MTLEQIPLLLDMHEHDLALSKAVLSGNADFGLFRNFCQASLITFYLVYLVLFNLKHRLSLGDFFRLVGQYPVAQNMLEVYCLKRDLDTLRDLLYQSDRRFDSARLVLKEAWAEETVC
jgi:hypothetical protein